jgi:protein-L-isoaspartate(D-aspartate) O-methyltransferase
MPVRRARARPICLVVAWLGLGATAAGCVTNGQGRAVDTTQGASQSDPYSRERQQMVRTQIESREVTDAAVLAAMRKVPRHLFVPAQLQDEAYADGPLPIGHGQTISQPYIVAYMSELLRVTRAHKVLEIGTGSGYQAAVLGELAGRVFTIEILPELGERARALLQQLGYGNVRVRVGDGYLGWPEEAPFDRIMVTAAPDHVPPPLVDQLAIGGILVIPVGTWHQEIVVVTKTQAGTTERHTIPVRFVPLTRRPVVQ